MDVKTALLAGGIISTGLMSGLFYGWSVSVIPGTRRLGAGNYVETMQHINRAIINPLFIVPFIGIPVLVAGAALAQFRAGEHRRGWLLAAAAGTYVVGVLGVTIGRNVPLNDALDAFDLAGADAEVVERHRATYETGWNRWHHVRTFANFGAFALATAAATVSSSDA